MAFNGEIRIALYRGRGVVAGATRWFTRGRYSHAALLLPCGDVVEALFRDGVVRRPGGAGLNPGRAVDIYRICGATGAQHAEMIAFALAQVGKRYDWKGFLGFVTRGGEAPDRWLCSEIVTAATQAARCPIFKCPPHLVSPSMIPWSPRVMLDELMEVRGHGLAPR